MAVETSLAYNGLLHSYPQCLTMTIGNSSDEFWTQHDVHQKLQITPGFLQDNSNMISYFLKNNFLCSIFLVTHLDFLLPTINLLKLVDHHMIVYSGTIRPPDAILIKEDRPIVMLPKQIYGRSSFMLGDLYCPRETKLMQPDTKQIILHNRYGPQWINNVFDHIYLGCPNPLSKQTLYGASSLGRIIRNGKLVGGHHASLFWYLGKKFNFNAVFKADIGGYDAKTNTYRGMSKKVIILH